jgi:hypothetical protein
MKEAEARTKWCPFAREAQEGIGTYNRIGGDFIQDRDEKGAPLFKDKTGKIGTKEEVGIHAEPLCHTTPVQGAETCLCLGSKCMAWTEMFVPGEGRCGMMPLPRPR